MPTQVTAEEVVDRVASLRRTKNGTIFVAIDGLGGAGKTTLARRIAATVPDITTICLDDFAGPNAPFDYRRFIDQVLDPLLQRRPGRYHRWDWDTDSAAEWHDVPVGGVVVVEGVSATREELGHPWDLTVWVSAPASVRLQRGVDRDGEALRWKWTDVWMPAEDAYVAAQQPDERADLVIDGTSELGE